MLNDSAMLGAFFWFAFGGCLLALIVYDLFHILINLLPDFLQVVLLWGISKWGKR